MVEYTTVPIGRSQAAVKDSEVCFCVVCMASGTMNAVKQDSTNANHHKPAAASRVPFKPYASP